MLDCCLVNMPFSDLKRPSLALGLLQGILLADGMTVRSVYANLLHAESTGLWLYSLATQAASRTLIGDWCFVDQAFPGAAIDHQGYLEHFCRAIESLKQQKVDKGRLLERLWVSKQRAEAFLDELVKSILELRPRVVGCTSTFLQRMSSLALLRRLRQEAGYELVTMMGGANCEAEMGLATHHYFPWVDYVVSGEADDIISPLMRLVLEQGRGAQAGDLPPGVFAPVHRQEGYPRLADGRAPRNTLRALGNGVAPHYDDYFTCLAQSPSLKASLKPALPFETSRGCWWGEKPGCRFCGLCGQAKVFRSKPVDRALELLSGLVAKHGIKAVAMADNILDPQFFDTLLPRLAQEPWASDLRIFYETRSTLSLEQVRALERAGVRYIQAGVESLHSKCLELMNKGCQAWQSIQMLKWCRQAGVRVVWHILYDLPGEKDEWYSEMAGYMPLLHHLTPPTLFTFIKLDRFCDYHDHPEKYGLNLEPAPDYAFLYPIPAEGLAQLAYDFDDPGRSGFRLNPFAQFLRPQGQEAAREAYFAWRRQWSASQDPPLLQMRDGPQGLEVRDTRAVAVCPIHLLGGLEREIYLECRQARRLERLKQRLAERGHVPAAVESAISALLEAKLSLLIDGRLMSLAIEEPERPYPPVWEFPLGSLDMERFWQVWQERRAGQGHD
ncbi:MAG: RiPP maturation radical SAM protein 1 [Desulfarculus sp.]|nr:RiPP maturation radical SAM protein 1 [Desulfarculus sp.]